MQWQIRRVLYLLLLCNWATTRPIISNSDRFVHCKSNQRQESAVKKTNFNIEFKKYMLKWNSNSMPWPKARIIKKDQNEKKKHHPTTTTTTKSQTTPLCPPNYIKKKKENQVHSCIEFGIYLASNTLMDDKDFRPSFSMSFC